MPGFSVEDARKRVEIFIRNIQPYVRLLPRNNPDLLEHILDTYEQEELQRLNDELQEKKRLLEERLAELNIRLQELEDLKNRLERERKQLAEYCDSMEVHVLQLEHQLSEAMEEADRLQLTQSTQPPSSSPSDTSSDSSSNSSDEDDETLGGEDCGMGRQDISD
ncbi:hypothetical protein BV898_08095 [Hypsibius exemplaris]|uniref:Uncharacterized protein n=1 Tax=Hypsibius exemplaris TaxID=2072580 RepID=A0A1W0WRI3_HYPEX|nr:hypothetical protein BV898_08095 [Hypsibius exemplaris]